MTWGRGGHELGHEWCFLNHVQNFSCQSDVKSCLNGLTKFKFDCSGHEYCRSVHCWIEYLDFTPLVSFFKKRQILDISPYNLLRWNWTVINMHKNPFTHLDLISRYVFLFKWLALEPSKQTTFTSISITFNDYFHYKIKDWIHESQFLVKLCFSLAQLWNFKSDSSYPQTTSSFTSAKEPKNIFLGSRIPSYTAHYRRDLKKPC